MSLSKTVLHESNLLQIRHVACHPKNRGCSDIEQSQADVLVLPLRGSFMKHLLSGKRILAEPSQALIFAAGRPYQISHMLSEEDECLAFEFTPSIWTEVLESSAATDSTLNIATHFLLPARAIAARSLLWRRMELGLADSLEVEESAIALLACAICYASNAQQKKRSNQRRLQQIEATKIALLKYPEKKWTLSALADHVSVSPYHLTRIFCNEVGVPVYQFHLRARLAGTIDALLNANTDVTNIALDYGFSSHSHFTAAFRRMVGITPSEFRHSANSKKTEQTRNNLIAALRTSL